jgi:hypothetical protein
MVEAGMGVVVEEVGAAVGAAAIRAATDPGITAAAFTSAEAPTVRNRTSPVKAQKAARVPRRRRASRAGFPT